MSTQIGYKYNDGNKYSVSPDYREPALGESRIQAAAEDPPSGAGLNPVSPDD